MKKLETKVLHVRWDPSADCLVFDFSDVVSQAVDLERTMRHIDGIASRFYDPIGFVSPVTVRFKMLFQSLCQAKLQWDAVLVAKPDLETSTILTNQYLSGYSTNISCSLQGFCDASKLAYAAVVYLTVDNGSGQFGRFVARKSRVSLLKEQAIPCLELLSALLLSKLMSSVSQALEPELPLGQLSYFTDS